MKRHYLILLPLLFWAQLAGAQHNHGGLVPLEDVTHTAVVSGPWSSGSIWDAGSPGAGAVVHIPHGVIVTYDVISDVRLDRVRVDGVLRFSDSASSRIVLDTLTSEHGGELIVGTLDAPIPPGVTVEIVITSDADIDVARDPMLMSRGVVANGPVRIHGARKTVHGKVARDPLAGDQELVFQQAPQGWQVGDTLVLTGTRYSGWRWDNDIRAVRYFGTQDEVLTVTGVSGTTVSIDRPLEYDHDSPRPDLKASVANFSRNITIATENGDQVPRHRRGPVMFTTADVDVRFVAMHELGRTDKSVPTFEAGDLGTVVANSNVRGRYGFHFHRTGIADLRNPGIAIGNAVFRSPGWGFVHHDSNAVFHDNASFDTFGAGFVAETGNETGSWTRNIAIRAEGNSAFNPKNGNDVANFDMGRTGDGFWFQGRMVRSVGNIAASVNHGYVYLHRGTGMLGFEAGAFAMPEALRRRANSAPDDAPILNFHGNEAFASTVGVFVVKANPNQQHDVHSHLSDFTAWSVEAGANLEYTSHYLLEDFDLVGKDPEPFNNPATAIEFGNNTSDMVINGARMAGFATGIALGKGFTDETIPPSANQYVVIDPIFENIPEPYSDQLDTGIDQLLTVADLVPGRFSVVIDGGAPLTYDSPATSAGSGVVYGGEKTDAIGVSPIPAGTDDIGTPSQDMIGILEQDGYYRASDGTPYAVVEEFFTDRATGEIHKIGLVTALGPDVEAILGNRFHAWRDAFERGPIDLLSQPPVAVDDFVSTTFETPVLISPIDNDSDPDGDVLVLDGHTPPNHGRVFDNGDGTLTYVPDYDFSGEDHFRYWAYDDNGNYVPAAITISVGGTALLFRDGFE